MAKPTVIPVTTLYWMMDLGNALGMFFRWKDFHTKTDHNTLQHYEVVHDHCSCEVVGTVYISRDGFVCSNYRSCNNHCRVGISASTQNPFVESGELPTAVVTLFFCIIKFYNLFSFLSNEDTHIQTLTNQINTECSENNIT